MLNVVLPPEVRRDSATALGTAARERYRAVFGFAPGCCPFCLGATPIVRRDAEGTVMASPDKRADRLAQVRAQVDYHHRRLILYQRLHGSRPTARLDELEHAYRAARKRMADAGAGHVAEPGPTARSPRS